MTPAVPTRRLLLAVQLLSSCWPAHSPCGFRLPTLLPERVSDDPGRSRQPGDIPLAIGRVLATILAVRTYGPTQRSVRRALPTLVRTAPAVTLPLRPMARRPHLRRQ